jgi:hypothetical protein
MATKRKTAAPKKSVPLVEPRTVDPLSGLPLKYVETSAGWQVRAPGWVSASFFPFREHAEWWASHELGEPPTFQNPYQRVSTRDLSDVREADEHAAEVDREADRVEKGIDGLAQAVNGA